MGPLINLIQTEGPEIEAEATEAAEVIEADAEVAAQKIEQAAEAAGQKIEQGAEAAKAEAQVLAQEAEQEGEKIMNKIEQALGDQPVGQTTTPCGGASVDLTPAIHEALASADEGTQLEGQVAQGLKDAGFNLQGFQAEVGPNGSIGEKDIETSEAIIETTVSSSGKLSQVTKLMSNPEMNPSGKPVILYAPNYGGAATNSITQGGAYVAKNMQELTDLLRMLGGK